MRPRRTNGSLNWSWLMADWDWLDMEDDDGDWDLAI